MSAAALDAGPPAEPRIPRIVTVGDPVLRARAAEVAPEQIGTPGFQQLVDAMIAAMRNATGVGLAAPQIGVSLRVIVLEDDEAASRLTAEERRDRGRDPFGLRIFVNPVLRRIGEETALFFEGCLSIPGYAAAVERYLDVEVSGLDRDGGPQTWLAHGWAARILQHEIDHLDGVLYTDRMIARSFTAEEHMRARYAGMNADVLRRTFATS